MCKPKLVRMTPDYDCFLLYRRAFARLDYSYFPDSEISEQKKKEIRNRASQGLFNSQEYESQLSQASVELYFIKNEKDEIIGATNLFFDNKGSKCILYIGEFFLYNEYKRKGLGTIVFNLILEKARERKVFKIEMWCPFLGAQKFWEKMGFRQCCRERERVNFEMIVPKK